MATKGGRTARAAAWAAHFVKMSDKLIDLLMEAK